MARCGTDRGICIRKGANVLVSSEVNRYSHTRLVHNAAAMFGLRASLAFALAAAWAHIAIRLLLWLMRHRHVLHMTKAAAACVAASGAFQILLIFSACYVAIIHAHQPRQMARRQRARVLPSQRSMRRVR